MWGGVKLTKQEGLVLDAYWVRGGYITNVLCTWACLVSCFNGLLSN